MKTHTIQYIIPNDPDGLTHRFQHVTGEGTAIMQSHFLRGKGNEVVSVTPYKPTWSEVAGNFTDATIPTIRAALAQCGIHDNETWARAKGHPIGSGTWAKARKADLLAVLEANW